MEYADKEFLEEIFKTVNNYMEFLASQGLEMDEDGDLVDSMTKEKVLKIDDKYE